MQYKFADIICYSLLDKSFTTNETTPLYTTEQEKLRSAALTQPGPKVIKNSYSAQPSMNFFLLLNVEMPITVGILTF